jgi:dihydroorotate dehydrogenase
MLPPEAAHRLTIRVLASGCVPTRRVLDPPALACKVWGLDFSNPIGLAAGFDKNAEAVDALIGQGFGFVEIGTVTPYAQPGNPRPRLFRLEESEAVINRLGFNSDGLGTVAERLYRRSALGVRRRGIVGANIGMNRDSKDPAADFATGAVALAGLADYLVINVSSPNTPGLRGLQAREQLSDLLNEVIRSLDESAPDPRPPLLVKVAPDLTEEDRDGIVEVVLAKAPGNEGQRLVDGIIIGNTTISRPPDLVGPHREELGGLSGRPLFRMSTDLLADFYRRTEGQVPLVGLGGVSSGADTYAKIRAGASLVQLYTALIYQGPALVRRIKADLAAALGRDGFANIAEAVGADHQ